MRGDVQINSDKTWPQTRSFAYQSPFETGGLLQRKEDLRGTNLFPLLASYWTFFILRTSELLFMPREHDFYAAKQELSQTLPYKGPMKFVAINILRDPINTFPK